MPQPLQLSLPVVLDDQATFDSFFCADQPLLGGVVDQLRGLTHPDAELCIFLWGEEGSGRSHLLQATCHHFISAGLSAQYLPLAELAELPPESLLADLEQQQLICLDDVDAVAEDPAWQEALFHLFNRSRALGHRLVFSARMAPRQLPLTLEDLRTRLEWGLVFHLPLLGDEEKLTLLQWCSLRRGLKLERDVAEYILRRAPRRMTELLAVLAQLDRESLLQQRRLTIPFVRATLGW